MSLSVTETWSLCARLIALAVVLQSLELLALRDCFTERGIWRHGDLRTELRALPFGLRTLALRAAPYPAFVGVLGAQVLLGAWLLAWASAWLTPLLFLSALLVSLRFRGSFNGGSDSMTLLVLLTLSIAGCSGKAGLIASGAIGYLGLQTVLSYLLAGVAKLKEPSWRNGKALSAFVGLTKYGVPAAARRALQRPAPALFCAWLIMGFECSFPLALLNSAWCSAYVAAALAFHLANTALFGLNRFLFAWTAAYPALFYLSQFGPLATRH